LHTRRDCGPSKLKAEFIFGFLSHTNICSSNVRDSVHTMLLSLRESQVAANKAAHNVFAWQAACSQAEATPLRLSEQVRLMGRNFVRALVYFCFDFSQVAIR